METSKIRVVHLVRNMKLRAGIERVIFNLSNFMDYDRYEVWIYVFSNDPVPEDWLYKNKNVKILQQSNFPFEIKHNLPRIRIASYRLFMKAMKQINPQIVHFHFDNYYTLVPYLLSKKISARFIMTIHTMHLHSRSKRLLDKIFTQIELFSVKGANMVVVPVSFDMYEFLMNSDFKLGKEHYRVIQNGIDEEFFNRESVLPADLSEFGISSMNMVLINSARLEPEKNQEVIIRAMQLVVKTHPHVKLLCLGNKGSGYNYCNQLVDELNLQQHVFFIGERTNISAYLAAADIGVFPSKWEGLSNALLEMMCMGLPVIFSDIPSSLEVTSGMDYPLFISVNEYQKLAGFLTRLLDDEAYCQKLGEQCRQQVINKFTARNQAKKYMELYESLLL